MRVAGPFWSPAGGAIGMNTKTRMRACSSESRSEDAMREISTTLGDSPSALKIVFASSALDRGQLARAIAETWPGEVVIGCTTADGPGSDGLSNATISAIRLPAEGFEVATEPIRDLDSFDAVRAVALVDRLHARLGTAADGPAPGEYFAMLLVDGLSLREEVLAEALQTALAGVPMFGGSAGDGMKFGSTAVLVDGAFESGCGVLVLVRSHQRFRVFKTQHVRPGERALVVTRAEPRQRRVAELDGLPAITAYARAVGLPESEVTADVFASHPLILRVGDGEFVRAIHDVGPDGSIRFFCAIEEGLVLRIADPGDMASDLDHTMCELDRDLGGLGLVIGCDCLLRRIEASREPMRTRLARVYASHPIVAFSTYGEQYHGMHVNQTFTGVAIGSARREAA